MKDLIFQVIDWQGYDDQDTSEYMVDIFGRNIYGKSVKLTVDGFEPYIFVKLDSKIRNGVDSFIKRIQEDVPKKFIDHLIYYEVVIKKDLYVFNNYKKFKFLKLVFSSKQGASRYASSIRPTIQKEFTNAKGDTETKRVPIGIKANIYESNIDPLLRFMHNKNLKGSGWIKVGKKKLIKSSKKSNCDHTYTTSYDNIKLHDTDEIAKFRVLSYDIECERPECDGCMPDYKNPKDRIIQIGMVYNYVGDTECYEKVIITIGNTTPINGVRAVNCKDEKELLIKFKEELISQDPDIIVGHNIFGFDYTYIHQRAKHLKVSMKLSKISRNKNEKCEFTEKMLRSSALGDNILKFYNIPGRVNVDILNYTRSNGQKLNSYSLDSLAYNYIRNKVTGTVYDKKEDITVISTKGVDGARVGNYLGIGYVDGPIEEKCFDGEKFLIKTVDKSTITVQGNADLTVVLKNVDKYIDTGKVFWCQAKNDIDHKLVTKYQHGTDEQRAFVAKYCIQDCVLVTTLMEKLKVIVNNIGMSNVTSVPFSFLFLRGQSIKVLSLLSKECANRDHLIPVLNPFIGESWYEGAIVFEPKVGAYYDPIPVLDYGSLYPSSMILRNISHETLVKDPRYDNLEGYIYHDVTIKNADGTPELLRFAEKKDGEKAIVPAILMQLLSARKKCKKMCADATDPFMKVIYDGLQLAYKLTANSIYGNTGCVTSSVYMREIAAATTATGREMLEYARYFSERDMVLLLKRARTMSYSEFETIYNKLFKYHPHKITCKNGEVINVHSLDNTKIKESKFSMKNKFNNKKEFIKYIFNKCSENFNKYEIDIKTIYGDTDSVFIKPEFNDKYLIGRDKRELSIKLGILTGDIINILLPQGMVLEYEKTFDPFIILTKKRYVGNLYEFDPDKFTQKSMGIVLKRRDNANIVKIVCGNIVDKLINKRDPEGAVNSTRKVLKNIIRGKYGLDKFVISKTLKSFYEHRDRHPHVALADRLAERDPASKPQTNDRVPYAFVYPEVGEKFYGKGKSWEDRKLSDFVENPEYIKENNMRINYIIYIRDQIKNSAVQFLELVHNKGEKIFDDIITIEHNYLRKTKPIMHHLVSIKPKDGEENLSFCFDDPFKNDKDKEVSKTKRRNKKVINEINNNDDMLLGSTMF